jgi:hypothetical protein
MVDEFDIATGILLVSTRKKRADVREVSGLSENNSWGWL